MKYIASASAGYAGPAPDEEKYFISMPRLEEVNYAALTIQRDGDGPVKGLCARPQARRSCKRSCGRSGGDSWRVCQWEPAPR